MSLVLPFLPALAAMALSVSGSALRRAPQRSGYVPGKKPKFEFVDFDSLKSSGEVLPNRTGWWSGVRDIDDGRVVAFFSSGHEHAYKYFKGLNWSKPMAIGRRPYGTPSGDGVDFVFHEADANFPDLAPAPGTHDDAKWWALWKVYENPDFTDHTFILFFGLSLSKRLAPDVEVVR